MPRPVSLLPALVAVTALLAGLPAADPAAAAVRTSAAADEPEDPLLLTLDSLTPGEVPERGRVRMTGTVTNVSDERWRAINVHAFVGTTPMTTSEELREATELPDDAVVGERIFLEGTVDSIGGLEPGETATYRVRLDRDQIPVSTPGVYWFGAHALGNTTEERDAVADGRARTFLPLVSEASGRSAVDTSLVVPLRRAVRHTRGGRILDARGWARALAPGGSLSDLTDLGAAAPSGSVTWLVDPAVIDAVERLVAGNLPRSLSPAGDDGEGGADEEPSPSAPADPEEESGGESGDADPPPHVASAEGAAWLERWRTAVAGDPVLALPFGDPDASALADHGPGLLRTARQRADAALGALDPSPRPAIAPPEGYLSTEALAQLPDGTLAMISDQMLPSGPDGSVFESGGTRVVVTDSATALGGPGPGDPLASVALRQRILAEAAVRSLTSPRAPLVVMLPSTWTSEEPEAFLEGLDVDWLRLTDAGSLAPARELDPGQLDYPPEERGREIPAVNVTVAQQLIDAGLTLANVLSEDDDVGQQVTDEALASLSYGNRRVAEEVLSQTEESLRWVDRRLAAVRVNAPPGVTLSGASGSFATTVTNRLDQPVTVSLTAITDADLSVDTPSSLDLAPGGSQTVLLNTQTTAPGVHYVRLVVTDDEGAPLGSSATLPVRSAQVSAVIWVILGVGVGLLFLAIAVRLVRRIRSERG